MVLKCEAPDGMSNIRAKVDCQLVNQWQTACPSNFYPGKTQTERVRETDRERQSKLLLIFWKIASFFFEDVCARLEMPFLHCHNMFCII